MTAQGDAEAAAWNAGVGGELARLDTVEPSAPEGDGTVPEGAPEGFAAVRRRVERGELTWVEVMEDGGDDDDRRSVHVWLSGRLDAVRQALRTVPDGVDADAARASFLHTLTGLRDGADSGRSR